MSTHFFFTLAPEALKASVANHDILGKMPSYRWNQILNEAYGQRIAEWTSAMTLPKSLRDALKEAFLLRAAECVLAEKASDSTEKFLLRLKDGALIESVVIDDEGRLTLCVSSQVGCAFGCRFCASGMKGFKRNLSVDEILSQVLVVEDTLSQRGIEKPNGQLIFDNIVFMGMGEPLANRLVVEQTLDILNQRFHFGARRITISTSGVADEILELAKNPLQFRLAVSLHATRDEIRDQLMPINQKFPLKQLIRAIETFSRAHHGGMVTLEYILIRNINHSQREAQELIQLAQQLHAHVNLIPYNPVQEFAWERPSKPACLALLRTLQQADVSVTLRREKGGRINAACGQLRLRHEGTV